MAVMATIVTTTEVCDVCSNKRRAVNDYRIGLDGQLVKVTLCKEHGAPLAKLLALGVDIPNHSPHVKVWDMAEIEKAKAAQHKKEKS